MKKHIALPLAAFLAGALVQSGSAAAETVGYSYDVHGRLTAVSISGVQTRTTTYAYDKADNRTAVATTAVGYRFYVAPLGGGKLIVIR